MGIHDYLTRFVCEEDKEEFARKTQYEVVLHEIHRQPFYSNAQLLRNRDIFIKIEPPGGLPWAGMLWYYIATVITQPSRKDAAPWEEVRCLFAEVRGK